jgi:hypothetical protein
VSPAATACSRAAKCFETAGCLRRRP